MIIKMKFILQLMFEIINWILFLRIMIILEIGIFLLIQKLKSILKLLVGIFFIYKNIFYIYLIN